jgi:hypothetical protein
MKTLAALIAFVGVIALAACGSTGGGDGGGCGGGGGSDMTDTMVDNVKEATHTIGIHANAEAGQYWETSSEAYGTTTTMRWQVSKVEGSSAIVEMRMTAKGPASYDYVTAYEVDTSKGQGEPNVTKAWVGKPGEAGKEIAVMAVQSGGCNTANYEKSEEDFADVEMAGGKWSGKIVTMKGEGWESKSWMAENGWFGGVIKTEAGGMVTSLTAFGTDASPILKW